MKRAYSISSFCGAYEIGRTKTYDEINSGRLKTVKVGRRRIIPHDNAEEWLANLDEGAGDEG